MTPKQEAFCQQYIVDYNGTQAAIRAGYSERTARSQAADLLAKPDILARVRELQAEQTARLCVTADWVVQQLVDVYTRAMQAEPVMAFDYDAKELVETGEYQFDSRGACRALELIGKHLGMYQDKLRVDGLTQVVIHDDISDA